MKPKPLKLFLSTLQMFTLGLDCGSRTDERT